MPLPTLAATITPAGISAPTYSEILQSLQESFRIIYGNDIYIEPDSQDGQLLALFAQGISDANQMAISVYNSYSPTYAQGAALSSEVKINGIRRLSPSNSTATGLVVGVAGTIITDGVVADQDGNLWDLPASVTIPPAGEISITVTAQEVGAIVATTGTINQINTPTLGWQSFASTSDATVGAPVESDASLRRRQATAASLPSQSPLAGMLAALANLASVTRVRVYENTTGSPDADGLPAHAISVVIEGGDLGEIAETIGQKKTPGAATYGTTAQSYTDPITGIVYSINFFILADTAVTVDITLTALAGWNSDIENEIKEAIAAYVNSSEIGQDVSYSRLWGPAYLNGQANGLTYNITVLQMNGAVIDVPVAFNRIAAMDAADVTITVSP